MTANAWARLGVVVALTGAAGALLSECSGSRFPEPPELGGDAGDDAGVSPTGGGGGQDGGSVVGVNDGGVPVDAGTGPAGAGAALSLPSLQGWQFFGVGEGGPRKVLGVTSDQGGNIWVAGGDEGLFLLTPGAARFRRFGVADGLTSYTDANGIGLQKVLSVGGGPAGTVFVGYQGHFAGLEEMDPPAILHSGGVDRVSLLGGGIAVNHLELASPPGTYPQYPAGRYKIRDVLRIVYDRATGDVWFGGNHGIAMWNQPGRTVVEHQHAAINGFLPNGSYTLLSGDWYGIGLDPAGDVWFGGGHRVARLKFASQGRQFWGAIDPVLDVWPDAVPSDARPSERTDDLVQDLAVAGDGTVWVGSIPNGLAHLRPSGTDFYTSALVDRRVTALEVDPKNGSLWVGHLYGGLTRILGGSIARYDWSVFGQGLVNIDVPDIQSDQFGGRRRLLVAFHAGAIGIYTGD